MWLRNPKFVQHSFASKGDQQNEISSPEDDLQGASPFEKVEYEKEHSEKHEYYNQALALNSQEKTEVAIRTNRFDEELIKINHPLGCSND